MSPDRFNAFCAGLPHATHAVQWGGAHVWKVGGKVFTIGGWRREGDTETAELAITFKCSAMTFEMLQSAPGMRPAPYLASRGMLWLQRFSADTLDAAALERYLSESYRLVSLNLTKRLQKELGLNPGAGSTA